MAELTGPDLTATNLAAIDTTRNYNLGPTGLRGWIHVAGGSYPISIGANELMTSFPPYQVLVTTVGTNTPASGMFQVRDVILGVNTGSNNIPVPLFTNDTRRAIGKAIGAAEAGDGWMNFKIWRGGARTNLSIRLPWHGVAYSATAPYNCPKSALILSNAINVIANRSLGQGGIGTAAMGLALLATGNTNFLPKVRSCARSITATSSGLVMWDYGYNGIFLSEYYLKTGDTNVLPVLNTILLNIANGTDRYGTVCHNPSFLKDDGSYNGTACGYGPVNNVGLAVDLALVMGKKSLVAAGLAVDPAISAAITRGTNFFGWHVQKGEIQYGEHNPWGGGSHASNGKHPMAALMFAMTGNSPVETEYWTRLTLAGYLGREYGHTGQGLSYLWEALGANVGGPTAMAAYMSNIRWHLDLERRCDGSFVYDGGEQYGPSAVSDYWAVGGNNAYGYGSLDPTACYVLTYAVPLRQIYLTGRDANPANVLSKAKVANAFSAALIYQSCANFTTGQLMAALGEYEPAVRFTAAEELGKRPGVSLAGITNLASSPNAWLRASACTVLGSMKDTNSLAVLGQCLSDPDVSVRAHAALALKGFEASASPLIPTMLKAFIKNAADPNVIDWKDPVQIANGLLSDVLFGGFMIVWHHDGLVPCTATADRNLLYPALRLALKHPDSLPRGEAADFIKNRLSLADIQALAPDLIECATTPVLADPMWRSGGRTCSIQALAKYNCAETVPVGLSMLTQPWCALGRGDAGDWDSANAALGAIASFGDSVRWVLPTLHNYSGIWNASDGRFPALARAINTITVATNSPSNITNLFPVAKSQAVATTNTVAITLTGWSCRTNTVTFRTVTGPEHGVLTGTAPNLAYTRNPGYSGVDAFTFQVADQMTSSAPATVSIIVGKAGAGLQGRYYDGMDFTNVKRIRTDPQINFDWEMGCPTNTMGPGPFCVRWKGMLLAPEDGLYTFSAFSGDGVRVYLGGIPVIDDWNSEGRRWIDGQSVRLAGGKLYALQMDFHKDTGKAVAKLKWTGPSFAGTNGVWVGSPWLYEQDGMKNLPVYAYPQSVVMVQNTNQVITLDGGPVAHGYQIETGPAHGRLSGQPPAMIYTPAAGYEGGDRFTFSASDHGVTSAAATVSIQVLAGKPAVFYWTNTRGGTWSEAGNWTDSRGKPGAPSAGGQPYYNLNFEKSGAYAVSNDLAGDFRVNQLDVAATVTIGGGAINCINNGPILPRINQNSANAVTINAPLNLGVATTLGGIYGGKVTVNSPVSGAGRLIIEVPGILQITVATNTYSGGTVLNRGTLRLDFDAGHTITPVGTGPLTVGGELWVGRGTLTNALVLNGGTIKNNNGWGFAFLGPVALNGTNTVDTSSAYNGALWMKGNISGRGGFLVKGIGGPSPGPLAVSGTNTYSGPTIICSGKIRYNGECSVAPNALIINNSASAMLNYTGTRTINRLILGGEDQPEGTYGATNSTATYKSAYFDSSGVGTLTVVVGNGGISDRTDTSMSPPPAK